MKKDALLRIARNALVFVLLLCLTFFLIFRNQDFGEFISILSSTNKMFILIALLVMLSYFILEAINIKLMLKSFGEKISVFKGLKYTFIGYFFSAITPASSGGQPMEIYYMTKDKLSGANSTLALLIEACGYQIATLSLGIICAIINPQTISSGLLPLFILGILINGCALLVLLFSIFSERLTKKIVDIFLNILRMFKIKNLDQKKTKIYKALDKYNDSANYIKAHKGHFVLAASVVFLQILCLHSISYFVYRALGFSELSYLTVVTTQAVLFSMVSGIPLPGSVGISELVHLKIYNLLYPEFYIHSAMLLTRSINFYYYVLISLVVVLINAFVINIRDNK